MDGKRFALRSRMVLALLCAVMVLFAWVLFDLQVVNGSYYLEQSTRKIAVTEPVQAARGEILDRYGRLLVSNRAAYQVTVDTRLMGDEKERNETVLKLLEICREQAVEWNDNLPITRTAPFRFTVESPFENTTTAEDGTVSNSPTSLSLSLIHI